VSLDSRDKISRSKALWRRNDSWYFSDIRKEKSLIM